MVGAPTSTRAEKGGPSCSSGQASALGHMLPDMWRAFGGAILVIAGIAAFIEAGSHAPGVECLREVTEPGDHTCLQSQATGLSHTAYDLLRIGAWALVIIGALLVIVGLIGYWARAKHPA